MFCIKCGTELPAGAAFCPNCAEPVAPEETTPQPEPQPEPEPEPGPEPDSGPAPAPDDDAPQGPPASEPTPEPEPAPEPTPTPQPPRARKAVIGGIAAIIVAIIGTLAFTWLSSPSQHAVLNLEDVEDAAFRDYLAEHIDTDGNGIISQQEADAVTELGGDPEDAGNENGLSGIGITSLDGIETFGNLTSLACAGNKLTELDLSKNLNLEQVFCSGNSIGELILPPGDTLTTVHATENHLTEIDLTMQEGLTDVELDGGVTIIGVEAPTDEETVTKLEDMAVVYGAAGGWRLQRDDVTDSNILAQAGSDGLTDGSLIYRMVTAHQLDTRGLIGSEAYGIDYELEDSELASVPLSTGETIIRSFYGACPEDMSYIDATTMGLIYAGDGWDLTMPYAQSSPGMRPNWIIDTDNWFAYGKVVGLDADITYTDGEEGRISYTYRVTAVEDNESIFGYHLASMVVTHYEQSVSEESDNGSENDAGDEASDDEIIESIKKWGESESGGHSSSSAASSDTQNDDEGFDFDSLLGTWVGTFEKTRHNSVNGQAACYGGKNNPITITFKSVDAQAGTAYVDMSFLVHSHNSLSNPAESAEGDKVIELKDTLITITYGLGFVEIYSGRDLGSYNVKLRLDDDEAPAVEVYTETSFPNHVAWREDRFTLVKQ